MKTRSSESLCGLFLWIWTSGNRAWVSHFLLSLGAQDFPQLQAMAFLSILSCHFLPSGWICFTSTPCPRSVPGQQERAGDVGMCPACPIEQTQEGAPQMWAVTGIFVAGCKCHPWSLGSACWLHPRWPLQRERNTAAQAQPAPVAHTEEIFLNYLWSILVGTASERSS